MDMLNKNGLRAICERMYVGGWMLSFFHYASCLPLLHIPIVNSCHIHFSGCQLVSIYVAIKREIKIVQIKLEEQPKQQQQTRIKSIPTAKSLDHAPSTVDFVQPNRYFA